MSGEFWPFWVGGLVIGSVATLYPLFTGRLLGVSSSYASLFSRRRSKQEPSLAELEAMLLAETEAEFGPGAVNRSAPSFVERLNRVRAESERFRPWFLVGIVLGALVASVSTGAFAAKLTFGASFDGRYGEFGWHTVAVLLVSGIFIGLGTRIAGGCTSGHGISGVARGQPGSLLSTAMFWATALAVGWTFVWWGRG